MAFPWGLLTFLFGIVYGYVTPGRQDKMAMFKKGLIIGIILAIVFAIIGFLTGYDALGVAGAIGVLISIIVLSILFVAGTWVGDLLEGAKAKKTPPQS
jgi:cation transporter-like permease